MSIRYHADGALGCTIAVWDGDITSEDARKHLFCLSEDARWPPGLLHLADLTTVETISIPDPDLVELLIEGTTLAGRHADRSHCATGLRERGRCAL